MYKDIMLREKKAVGSLIGKYNKAFIEKWEVLFTKCFGRDGKNINNLAFD